MDEKTALTPVDTDVTQSEVAKFVGNRLPTIIAAIGADGAEEFLNFFAAHIRNKNTREAYLRAWMRFGQWCDDFGIEHLAEIRPLHVASYIESLGEQLSLSSVKLHRSALSKCFSFLVVRQVVPENPVAVVEGPKIQVTKGKTPVLSDDEFLDLIESIPSDTLIGKRDRAFISLLCYTWPRVSAAVNLKVDDYYPEGKRWRVYLGEKSNKQVTPIVHHRAQDALDAYLDAANIKAEHKTPLFRAFDQRKLMSDRPLDRRDALAMVKRRAKKAGLNWRKVCNHSFRATGITNYMANGGRIDVARDMASHSDTRVTEMYNRSGDKATTEEVERIRFERE